MVFSGSFSRGAALAAMMVTTERLGYAKLSAEQEEAHFLFGQDVFVSLPTGAPVLLPPFTYGNGLTANVNTVIVVDSA